MGLRASARSIPAPAWAIPASSRCRIVSSNPVVPGIQDVVVAQGNAVYAGLIQHGHQPEVACEGRRVGMIDGVSYDRVLEVGKRKVGARQVLPDGARLSRYARP